MGTLTPAEIELLESQAEGEESLVISKIQSCPEWPGILVTLNYFLMVVKAKIGHDQVRRLCVDCQDTNCPANLTGQNIDNQIRSELKHG
jgi:hypothetical protein